MIWSAQEINALKSQEAKDLAIELQGRLAKKDSAPISPGEVQLRELEYELKLKEAEAADARKREQHAEKLKELELQIQSEKARQAEAVDEAAKVQEEHARLIEKVSLAKQALSIELETATRENNLKVERLEASFKEKSEAHGVKRKELEEQRDKLCEEITLLADLKESADDVKQLREEIESRQIENQHRLLQLDEEFRTVEFEKTQKINAIKRSQEVELSELETKHKKDVMQTNQQAAREILVKVGMIPVKKKDWEKMKVDLDKKNARSEQEEADFRKTLRDEFLREFNITSKDVVDVTDLFYERQSLVREAESLRTDVGKYESEVKRMREHIEKEPSRISAAVEAAKVHIANNIEQSGKR